MLQYTVHVCVHDVEIYFASVVRTIKFKMSSSITINFKENYHAQRKWQQKIVLSI